MRQVLMMAGVLALFAACKPPDPAPGLPVLSGAALYVRSTFDADGTALIGAFMPDDVPGDQLDESKTLRTRCSDYIRPREVKAGGRTNEVLAASQSLGGSVGAQSIAKVEGQHGQSSAVRADYELQGKLTADIDQSGLQKCCRAYPSDCYRRYVASVVKGKGYIYAARERATSAGAQGQGTASGLPFGANAFYDDGVKWERRSEFDGQYFAFGLASRGAPGAETACDWVDRPRTSLDGEYFVGVSTPRITEQEARQDAAENAEQQVVSFMGKWIAQQASSTQQTSGALSQLQTTATASQNTSRMAEGLSQFLKVEEYCTSEELTPEGKRFLVKALAFLPNASRVTTARLSLANLMGALQQQGRLTPELKQQLEQLSAELK